MLASPFCLYVMVVVILIVVCCRLLDLLEIIAPFRHFNKLREFVDLRLPPGFPVKAGDASMV